MTTSLQDRLDAAFGALGRTEGEVAWRPADSIESRAEGEGEDSGDEVPREPLVAEVDQVLEDLGGENVVDKSGFAPSRAFCRGLDREEEFSAVDEEADPGAPCSRPPLTATAYEADLDDDVDDALAPPLLAQGRPTLPSWLASAPPRSSLRSSEPRRPAKRVSFRAFEADGRREEAEEQPRASAPLNDELAPPPSTSSEGPERPRFRGRVPQYVQHPERYRCFDLGMTLVVGGGIGQMSDELETGSRSQAESLDSTQTRSCSLDQVKGVRDEPERWIGGVGEVSFALPPGSRRPCPRKAVPTVGLSGGAAPVAAMEEDEEADAAASSALSRAPAGRTAGAARRPRARPQLMDEDERA